MYIRKNGKKKLVASTIKKGVFNILFRMKPAATKKKMEGALK